MVIDPVARSTDGESVRIAKDVLCAGAGAKICLPEGPEEFARALARRGHRRPVVIGDDRALLRVVGLLHRERELAGVPLSMVPVGAPAAVALSRTLGVPTDAVAAARAVLDGGERPMDLLTDDSDGIVLGGLRIPCGHGAPPEYGAHGDPGQCGGYGPPGAVGTTGYTGEAGAPGDDAADPGGGHRPWWRPAARTARTALSLLAPATGLGGRRGRVPAQRLRLRVEADGALLADLDRPVRGVSVVPGRVRTEGGAGPDGADAADGASGTAGAHGPAAPDVPAPSGGLAEVVVHWAGGGHPLRASARAVTVSGADFHYRADALVGGPVRTRTWTVQPGAWRLQLPLPRRD
ncbi:diacylglycerol kinase family protein [Streptomyces sp. CT34]|uniref:diacylglycerol kinase family protein n=1 Tax=Streptomyces sp. CT34 TaxID=1553907 RepID=UPI0005BAB40C|nr:diacylglycerol kinase family protein [Streptomyces sp. CT34]